MSSRMLALTKRRNIVARRLCAGGMCGSRGLRAVAKNFLGKPCFRPAISWVCSESCQSGLRANYEQIQFSSPLVPWLLRVMGLHVNAFWTSGGKLQVTWLLTGAKQGGPLRPAPPRRLRVRVSHEIFLQVCLPAFGLCSVLHHM
jgi:hypothetical protein